MSRRPDPLALRRRRALRAAVLGAVGALACTAVLAQAGGVWRCGPDGRLYSDQPCPGQGRAVPLAVDTPSAAERQAALAAARSERALLEALVDERHAREAQAAGAAGIRHTPAQFRPTALERQRARQARELARALDLAQAPRRHRDGLHPGEPRPALPPAHLPVRVPALAPTASAGPADRH